MRTLSPVLRLFLISRLVVFGVAYLAVGLIPPNADPAPYHLRGVANRLFDVFASRWDTGFYVSIAEEGYRFTGVDLPSVAFFPLLPVLMRAGGWLFGDVAIAGLLITNGALLGAAILFHRWASENWDTGTAERATWYLLVFPCSFFGSAIYTESLFLLLAVGMFLAARDGRWGMAWLLGFLAALTRFHGLALVVPLAAEWWRQRRSLPEREKGLRSWRGALAAVGVPLGTAVYAGYCWITFGTPLAFVRAAEKWGREPAPPLETVRDALAAPEAGWWAAMRGGGFHLDNALDVAFIAVFLALGCWLIAERRWVEGLFVLAGLSISFSSGLLMSQRRYVWILFPAFALLGQWGRSRAVDRLVTAVSIAGLALFTALFAGGYWVG